MKRQHNYNLCRRNILKGAAALASISVVPISIMGTALAAKASKDSVQYQDSPKGDMQCSNCSLYQPDGESSGMCLVVEGEVSATAWCAVWAPKS